MAKNDDIIQLLLYLARQKMIPRDDATLAVLLSLVDNIVITDTTIFSRTGHPTLWGSGNNWGFVTWGSEWGFKKLITIDQTKVDSDLTDFPVLVKLTSLNFNFNHSYSSGYDIRFMNSALNQYYKFELVEPYDAVNQTAEFWVKIPSISSTVDTEFYMVYGKWSAANESKPEAVWDANFKMVQHMGDGADTSHITDSTSNNNDGTKKAANEPIEAAGKIGKAQTFDGSDDRINIGNAASLQLTNLTLSAWIKSDIATAYHILGKRDFATSGSPGFFVGAGKLDFYATNLYDRYGNTTILADTWYHVTVTLDMAGPTVVTFYLNGNPDGTNTSVSTVMGTNPWGIGCGNGNAADQPMDGLIDEVRISNVVRSAAWIKAEYNAGNDTLLSLGVEVVL